MLIERDGTDVPVQEVRARASFAYSKLQCVGRAALLYRQGRVDGFVKELEEVDASTRRKKKTSARATSSGPGARGIKQDTYGSCAMRTLPDTPATFYLTELMASNDFQTALGHNYLERG